MQLAQFIETTLIPAVGGPITLAFDEVDRVLGRAIRPTSFCCVPGTKSVKLRNAAFCDPQKILDCGPGNQNFFDISERYASVLSAEAGAHRAQSALWSKRARKLA